MESFQISLKSPLDLAVTQWNEEDTQRYDFLSGLSSCKGISFDEWTSKDPEKNSIRRDFYKKFPNLIKLQKWFEKMLELHQFDSSPSAISVWEEFTSVPGPLKTLRKNYTFSKIDSQYQIEVKKPQKGFSQKAAWPMHFFDIIFDKHALHHYGTTRIYKELKEDYANITWSAVECVSKHCSVCVDPIGSSMPFDRIQAGLIEFSDNPSFGYKYILHFKDHFSKHVWFVPLNEKSGEQIAFETQKLFSLYPTPKVLETSIKKEFNNDYMKDYCEAEGIKLVSGGPSYFHCQGAVEKTSSTLRSYLLIQSIENPRFQWATNLAQAMESFNSTCNSATGKVPIDILYPEAAAARKLRNSQPHKKARYVDFPESPLGKSPMEMMFPYITDKSRVRNED